MNEVTKDTFWNTDLDKLPGALTIDAKTPVINSIWGVPVLNNKTSKDYIKKEIKMGEKFKNYPVVIFTEKVVDLASSILKKI